MSKSRDVICLTPGASGSPIRDDRSKLRLSFLPKSDTQYTACRQRQLIGCGGTVQMPRLAQMIGVRVNESLEKKDAATRRVIRATWSVGQNALAIHTPSWKALLKQTPKSAGLALFAGPADGL